MSDIDAVVRDGFSLDDATSKLRGIALLSLKIALKAYFSTYQTMKFSLHLFDKKNPTDQDTVDFNHSSSYCEACAETIVHLQHFTELVCKEFLRSDHPLLADNASKKPVILHKLIKGEIVTPQEMESIKSLEFSDAFERLCELVKENRLGKGQLSFLLNAAEGLKKLNHLRNRLWHRGTFILRYPALDEFVGTYVLPFVSEVVLLPEYKDLQTIWKYRELKCGIDPIEYLLNEFGSGKFSIGKVAILKELGRAAYENPLFGEKNKIARHLNPEHQSRAERIAKAEMDQCNTSDIRACPVCGIKALIVYDSVETEDENVEMGTYIRAWRYSYQIKCMCCTFELNHHLENPSIYGLPLKDYWHAEEL